MNFRWFFYQFRAHLKTCLLAVFPDRILSGNKKFKNLHLGGRCFILGSGHSIAKQDLSRLSSEIVITQNHFHSHPSIALIKPNYHVVVPKYQPTEFDGDWRMWLHSMRNNLPGDCQFFMGHNTKYLVDEMNIFGQSVNYIKSGFSNVFLKRAPVNLTKPIMTIPTVLTECLAIAIYMGFKEIYLVGFDLDQNIQLAKGSDRNNIRFYGKSPITANRYESEYENDAARSGEDWYSMGIIWHQCNLLKKTAEMRNIRILNATEGGILNVFDRVNYSDLFNEYRL
jgi:hypothetical protein